MDDISSLLNDAAGELSRAGIPEPRREASSLLELVLDRDRTFIIAHPEFRPDIDQISRFHGFIARRAGHEPFHYIAGTKEFYGLDFTVSSAVLIPRPETEMLVEHSIELLAATKNSVFCEVGVGSGCISVAILANLKDCRAVGLEISESAISVARHNADLNGVGDRFDIRRSDLFSGIYPGEQFELIVSNPPYVQASDIPDLQPEVRDHEPITALTDGADGLSIIARLVAESPAFLKPGGNLLFEFGIGQSEAVRGMFPADNWPTVRIFDDYQGIPRVVMARYRK